MWTIGKDLATAYTNIPHPGLTNDKRHFWIYASIRLSRAVSGSRTTTRVLTRDPSVRVDRTEVAWCGGSGGTGFAKDYSYDSRLQFASPPYFPQWTNAAGDRR